MPESKQTKGLQSWSPATYLIKVKGALDQRWSDSLAGMRITSEEDADGGAVTCLTGRLLDQSQLTGVLNGLAEMHLPILSVEMIGENNGLE